MVGCCLGGPLCAGALSRVGYVTARGESRLGWISRGTGRSLHYLWTNTESCRSQMIQVTGAQVAFDSCLRFDQDYGITDSIVSGSRHSLEGLEASVRLARDGLESRAGGNAPERGSAEGANAADSVS